MLAAAHANPAFHAMGVASRVAAPAMMTVNELPKKKTMLVDGLDVDQELPKFGPTFFPARDLGDFGFDPLGLGNDNRVVPFRHAELKHGRLAMLAAVAWPLQEIFHPIIVDWARETNALAPFFVRDVLAESEGKSPSLLNGGLEQVEVLPALSLAVFAASVLELRDVRYRESQGLPFNAYDKQGRMPGDLAFDPLNICRTLPEAERLEFMEKELLNGRLAMCAITSYVAIEWLFGMPVVRFTPDLFEPLFLATDFRAFMDASFSSASMDGSIDGIAY